MAHRTQITLMDHQYELLRAEAERTGASLSELIRRAVDDKYVGELTVDEKLALADRIAGTWTDEQAEEFLRTREEQRVARRKRLGF